MPPHHSTSVFRNINLKLTGYCLSFEFYSLGQEYKSNDERVITLREKPDQNRNISLKLSVRPQTNMQLFLLKI